MAAAKSKDNRLDLFLACDDFKPALEEPLPVEATQKMPKGKPGEANYWGDRGEKASDLAAQRWAVVAPVGPEGDQMLEAIKPLIDVREAEQGAPARIFRVKPDEEAKHWINTEHRPESILKDEQAEYLLLLGDFKHISLDFHRIIAHDAFVGRLDFARSDGRIDLDGFAAYAAKASRLALEGTPENEPEMLFFVADDGTPATQLGADMLVGPSLQVAERSRAKGKTPLAGARRLEADTVEALVSKVSGAHPSVLLSVSHGMGPPRRGFKNLDVQRMRQGALVLGHDELLDWERLQQAPFLPGGMWFCLACYSAGTPEKSAYHAWLEDLAQAGEYGGNLNAVLRGLPAEGEDPFIAAMPQAALKNPQGPLGIIGHVDLAWTYGFSNPERLAESKASRIATTLLYLARGERAGFALDGLMLDYRTANNDLTVMYEISKDTKKPIDPVPHGHKWMLRNDLRDYILLGDPAARLPLKQLALKGTLKSPIPELHTPKAGASSAAPVPPRGPAPAEMRSATASAPDEMRDAVLAVLRGESRTEIAAWYGKTLPELKRWVDTFVNAGCDALAKLDRS
jgi:hypothetical protein